MQQRVLACLIALGAFAAGAGSALANGFYVSGAAGGEYRSPVSGKTSAATDPYNNSVFVDGVAQPYQYDDKTRYDVGYAFDVAGGYRFDLAGLGAVRTELDFEYGSQSQGGSSSHSAASTVFGSTYSAHGSVVNGLSDEHANVTVNAFYDFNKLWFFKPYVGVGVGYHYGTLTSGERERAYAVTPTGNSGTVNGTTPFSGSTTVPVAQAYTHGATYLAEAGVSIPLTARLSLVPAYRYEQLFDGKAAVDIVKLGLRYDF